MPLSKKRKKKGKKVKHDPHQRFSGLTLQDLINVVAYQETHGLTKPTTIDFTNPDTQAVIKAVDSAGIVMDLEPLDEIAEDAVVTMGEGENKREIGTASPIPGDPEHMSIHITDPEVLSTVQGPMGNYSIDNPEILQDPGGKYSIDTKEQN